MAFLRAFSLILTLAGFFVLIASLQGFLDRRHPRVARWILTALCRSCLRILRVSLDTRGAVAEGDAVMLAVNHMSWVDVLVLGSVAPFCFLAKREVASWPVLSTFIVAQGTIFIDRSRRRGILAANRSLAHRMLGGRKVLLFPEGTTFQGPVPGRFLSSHFAAARDALRLAPEVAAVSIQPAALSYSSPLAAWIGDDALVPHLWRVLRGTPIHCRLVFGRPIPYRVDSDRKAVALAAREAVVAMLARAPMPGEISSAVPKHETGSRAEADRIGVAPQRSTCA